MRTTRLGTKTLLNGLSAGILVFLLVDILENAGGFVEDSLRAAQSGQGSWTRFAALVTIEVVAFGVGLLALVIRPGRKQASAQSLGPGAMAHAETTSARRAEALRLGIAIASGIGLHNFAEGLAIGQSASAGELSLAVLLVIGFGLHNATEGFGIVGPLASADVRPTWSWLLLAGLIGGGPTVLGTIVGSSVTSPYMFVGFLALAAGAILYVIGELFAVGRRLSWNLTMWGVFLGFVLGLATELVVVAAGA